MFRNTLLAIVLGIAGFAGCGGSVSNDNGNNNGVDTTPTISNLFPPYENAPALTSYVSGGTFNNTYYISPTGNDITGNGSIDYPWLSFKGATSGGSGTPVSAGDIIYARGGTYPIHTQTARKRAYYDLDRNGIANDYIVITKYPGETPVFTGERTNYPDPAYPSFSIHGNYVVIDGFTFDGGSFHFQSATNGVVQNSTFDNCNGPWGDQNLGTCIGLGDYVDQIVIRNNYFGPSSYSHPVKNYTSESVTSNVKVLYNRFYGIATSYGTISHKGPMSNWEYAYNRFEDCKIGITFGITYNYATDDGANIHHNAFDNVYQRVIDHGGAPAGEVVNMDFNNNIILNATTNNRDMLTLVCTNNGCLNSGSQPMGEFYNNVFYDVVDLIDPQTTSDFTNYPSYWNYNAYPNAAIHDSAENVNDLPAVNWQGSALIQPTHGITRTGAAGDRFYTIENDSIFIGAGRSGGYGDNIGGFTFGSQ